MKPATRLYVHGTFADGSALPPGPPAWLEAVLRQPAVGIALFDREGRYLLANAAYCRLYGHDAADLLGASFVRVLPPGAATAALERHRRFLEGRDEFDGEWHVRHRDGTPFTVLSASIRVPGPDGRPARLTFAVDAAVAGRHARHGETGCSTDHRLASAFDSVSAQVCVLDASARIVAVNRAWRDFAAAHGGRLDEVHEGASYLLACAQAARSGATDGAEAARMARLLAEVLAGQRTQFELEYACEPAAGEPRWFAARISRIEGSEPPSVVVVHEDITARRHASEAHRREAALLADLAAALPGVMFRMVQQRDGRWRFLYLSRGVESLLGTTTEAVYSDHRAMWARVAPADRAALDASVRAALAAGGRWEHEYRIVTPAGVEHWIHAKAASQPGEGGTTLWSGFLHDITERRRVEAELRASEQTFRNLFQTVPQGVVYHALDGRITAANPAAERILGRSLAQLLDHTSGDPQWRALREDGTPLADTDHPAMVALRTGRAVDNVVMGVQRPDGRRVWLLVSAMPVRRDGALAEVFASFEDISERLELARELRRQACTDELTGVANRRRFMERLQAEHERLLRHPHLQCALLALDIDHFKQVNDTHGHAAGDAVLVEVARAMRLATRQQDLVARWGGEEFMILLPDTGRAEATALAQRLRRQVQSARIAHGAGVLGVTVSIGVGALSSADDALEHVLRRADRALYRAKSAGRNAVAADGEPA